MPPRARLVLEADPRAGARPFDSVGGPRGSCTHLDGFAGRHLTHRSTGRSTAWMVDRPGIEPGVCVRRSWVTARCFRPLSHLSVRLQVVALAVGAGLEPASSEVTARRETFPPPHIRRICIFTEQDLEQKNRRCPIFFFQRYVLGDTSTRHPHSLHRRRTGGTMWWCLECSPAPRSSKFLKRLSRL